MTKNPGTFGPNNSPISKIIYSAIASWDGFVYQGCCGLCVVLEQILEDREQVETQFLNLDEYDDFAILDKDKNILSFHQVKCYKSGKNFEKDMALMEDKRKWWELKNLCKADAKLYFHSNMELNCYHNVEQYEYTIGEKALSPTGVVELIGTLIGKILEQKRWPGNVDTKRDALISLLDKHIALEDNELKKVRGNSSQSPNKNSIPVANIIDILQKSEVKPSVEDRVRTISFYLNLNLLQRI